MSDKQKSPIGYFVLSLMLSVYYVSFSEFNSNEIIKLIFFFIYTVNYFLFCAPHAVPLVGSAVYVSVVCPRSFVLNGPVASSVGVFATSVFHLNTVVICI